MDIRVLGAVCAVFLGCVSAAQAAGADPSIVVRTDSHHLRPAVIHAAEKLCTNALANDKFNDFGTLEECVDDTVKQSLAESRRDGGSAVAQLVAAVK